MATKRKKTSSVTVDDPADELLGGFEDVKTDARDKRGPAEKQSLPTNDAWTGMLFISLLALIGGAVLVFLDWQNYSDKPGALVKVPAIVDEDAPPPPPDKGGDKKPPPPGK
jgi:hypothetical protein